MIQDNSIIVGFRVFFFFFLGGGGEEGEEIIPGDNHGNA
jgi:hypothetical protein